jgi:hypothetical protein
MKSTRHHGTTTGSGYMKRLNQSKHSNQAYPKWNCDTLDVVL